MIIKKKCVINCFVSGAMNVLLCLPGYLERFASAPPLNLHQATCDPATDYTKKKHVLRLKLHDGAEFLLEAPSQQEMLEWNRNINRLAGMYCVGTAALRLT